MNINYSLKRVLLLTKANIVENHRSYLLTIIIATTLMTLICTSMSYNMIEKTTIYNSNNVEISVDNAQIDMNSSFAQISKALSGIMSGMYTGLLLVMCGFILISLFSNSLKKLKQPFRYTLPANISEKYTSNIIIAFIIVPICISLITIFAMFVTNILLMAISTTEFRYTYEGVSGMLAHFTKLEYIAKVFIVYGLILIGTIYKAGVKNKVITFFISLIIVVAVLSFNSLPKRLGIDTDIDFNYFLAPIIWVATYILFKRKELRS